MVLLVWKCIYAMIITYLVYQQITLGIIHITLKCWYQRHSVSVICVLVWGLLINYSSSTVECTCLFWQLYLPSVCQVFVQCSMPHVDYINFLCCIYMCVFLPHKLNKYLAYMAFMPNLGKRTEETNRSNQGSSNTRNNTDSSNSKLYIVVPYIKGMSESCKNICRKNGIQMHFRGDSPIKDLLVNPKDRDTIL